MEMIDAAIFGEAHFVTISAVGHLVELHVCVSYLCLLEPCIAHSCSQFFCCAVNVVFRHTGVAQIEATLVWFI